LIKVLKLKFIKNKILIKIIKSFIKKILNILIKKLKINKIKILILPVKVIKKLNKNFININKLKKIKIKISIKISIDINYLLKNKKLIKNSLSRQIIQTTNH
jgi:hypothetical protein